MEKVYRFVFNMKFNSYWNAMHWALNDGFSMVVTWGDSNDVKMHIE